MKLMYADGVSMAARDSVKDLLCKCIEKCYSIESEYFTEVEEIKRMEQNVVIYEHGTPPKLNWLLVPKSALYRFLEIFCLNQFEEKLKDLSKPVEYIRLICSMIYMNPVIPHFMARKGLLDKHWEQFIHMQKILNNSFPLLLGSSAKEKEKYHHQNVLLLIQYLELMIRSCITEHMLQNKSVPVTYLFPRSEINFREVPRIDEKILDSIVEHENFRKHLASLQEKNDCFLKIAQHVAWENKEISKKIIFHIVSNCCR